MCGAGHNLVKKSAIHPSCAIKMASVFRVVGPRFLFLFLFFFFLILVFGACNALGQTTPVCVWVGPRVFGMCKMLWP